MSWTDIATPTRPVDVYQLEITTLPRRPTRERQSDAVVASTNKTFLIIEYDSTQEQYIFRLRASNSAGSSEYSGQYQFDTSLPLGPTRGSVGPSDASSVVVWPIILIIILLLLCCVCCWICIIAITCVHRRKQRKSYPAEERGVSVRERERERCVSVREREREVCQWVMFIIVLSTISSTEKKFRDDDERYEFDLLEIWQLDFTHQILYKTFVYISWWREWHHWTSASGKQWVQQQ